LLGSQCCQGIVEIGDRVLGVDGHELKGRKVADVIDLRPSHTLRVLRLSTDPSWIQKAGLKSGHYQQQPKTRVEGRAANKR
jgi:hypothetical protein